MKLIYVLILICFNFGFYNLFCTEKPLELNNNESNFSTNISFNFGNDLSKNGVMQLKKNYDKTSDDFKKMIGFYVVGFTGVGITAFFTIGSIVCFFSIIWVPLIYISLGLFAIAMLLGIPFIVTGFPLASYHKKRAIIQNNVSQLREDSYNKPEIAFSIPL